MLCIYSFLNVVFWTWAFFYFCFFYFVALHFLIYFLFVVFVIVLFSKLKVLELIKISTLLLFKCFDFASREIMIIWHADTKRVNVLFCSFKDKNCNCENQQLHLSRLELNKPPIGKLINWIITIYCIFKLFSFLAVISTLISNVVYRQIIVNIKLTIFL